MRLSLGLLQPAAAEVRQMLYRIKLDNMSRGRSIEQSMMLQMPTMGGQTTPSPCPSPMPPVPEFAESDAFLYGEADGQVSRQSSLYPSRRSSADSLVSMQAHQMGSFTSMPKIIPAAESDDADVAYPSGKEDLPSFLSRCSAHLASLPPPIERRWRRNVEAATANEGETVRVLQWNVLSQALGTKNDNFVRCPPSALQWRTRRFRMLEEIARHDADVVCLQEVDHFEFLRKSLAPLGYEGRFVPKPDSPCLYLQENTGPDGCAIFYKADKFERVGAASSRVIEVWNVESNQVVLLVKLRSRTDPSRELVVATTHLKARNGALLSTLRNEQGKDIVNFIEEAVGDSDTPVVLTGDFNAEPTEPVFSTVTDSSMSLGSAYTPSTYTTWKIREDGEHKQTLDYIFHSRASLDVVATLDMPSGEEIGEARLPSRQYASDHFSLVADFRIKNKKK